jgi:uncharacterized RDD family membrane protein YckC
LTSDSFAGAAEPVPDPETWPELFDSVLRRRVIAYAIDLLCIGVVLLFAWLAAMVLFVVSFGLLAPLLWLALALIPLAYHTLLLGGPLSATIGMRCLDLELRTLDGERPSLLQALVQTVVFYVTVGATCWLVLLFVFVNHRKRTLHDILSGTIVVRSHALYQPA